MLEENEQNRSRVMEKTTLLTISQFDGSNRSNRMPYSRQKKIEDMFLIESFDLLHTTIVKDGLKIVIWTGLTCRTWIVI